VTIHETSFDSLIFACINNSAGVSFGERDAKIGEWTVLTGENWSLANQL